MEQSEIEKLHERMHLTPYKDGKGHLLTLCPLEMDMTAEQAEQNILRHDGIDPQLRARGLKNVGAYLAALSYKTGSALLQAAIVAE